MKIKYNRRSFIKRSGIAGLGTLMSGSFLPQKIFGHHLPAKKRLSIINGGDYFNNTFKAIELLGGMKKFVRKGSTVGLLINSDFEIFTTYTSPDVSIAVAKMCFDAGASEVVTLQNVKKEYWERSAHYENHKKVIEKIDNLEFNQFPCTFEEENFVLAEVPGVTLKKAEVVKKLFEVDVLINLPVAKHHASTIYTGALKNTMGIATRKTNVGMHLDSGIRNEPNYLAQCIVDLNLLRIADLIVADATEVLTSNGPMGPGETTKPMKIVACNDMVALDSYCCHLLGHPIGEVLTIKKAEEAGIGIMDYNKLKIKEI